MFKANIKILQLVKLMIQVITEAGRKMKWISKTGVFETNLDPKTQKFQTLSAKIAWVFNISVFHQFLYMKGVIWKSA